MKKIAIPNEVRTVLDVLITNGFSTFLVGGCVRDHLLGVPPSDYDIATSAQPDAVRRLFPKTVPIGAKHGTIAVVLPERTIEVSRFRSDKPDSGQSDDLEALIDDLSRRDFTINAMAFKANGQLLDPFGGEADLKAGFLRTPQGQAQERFAEDPLRLLRAVRFACGYGFAVDETTLAAMADLADRIETVSSERIREELNQVMLSDRAAEGIRMMRQAGLLAHVLPEIDALAGFDQKAPLHDKDLLEHTLAVVDASPKRLAVRLAALLHDAAKPSVHTIDEKGIGHFYGHEKEGRLIVETVLRRLKYDTKTIERVALLVAEHMSRYDKIRNAGLKRLIGRVGLDNLQDLEDLQRADLAGLRPGVSTRSLDDMWSRIWRLVDEKPPLQIADLAVGGKDLIAAGYEPGPELGRVLDRLLEVVLEDPDKNQREILLEIARATRGRC
ncbi:MAG: CCA tRNA nucleotidyltransferase [Solirubrobacterales bacterium]